MKAVQVYGLRRCSTCVKARKWLDANAIEHTFTDYRDTPVEPVVLTAWAAQLGWDVLVNKSSAAWRALSETEKQADTDAQWLALIAAHPTLVKRPVLVRDHDVMVGFSEPRYSEFFA